MQIIFTTVSEKKDAEKLAQAIVREKLAACVQIIPQITSVYFWNNEIQKDSEFLLLIKTFTEKYASVEKFLLTNHPYDVPEIVAVESEKVSSGYFEWMKDYLRSQ